MNTAADTTYDVAIVGYGPVGATLALLLQELGHSVVVVDRETEVARFPKAAHFDDEIVRLLQTMGLRHLIDDMAPPLRYVYFDQEWNIFLERIFPSGMSNQGYLYDYMFFQPDVEHGARERLMTQPNQPNVLLGHDVTHIEQDDTGANLDVFDMATGTPRRLRARYVVGCDGGRSTVRKTIGSAYEEISPSHDWYIVDVKVTGNQLPGLDQWEWCHPDRIVTMIALCGPYRRFEFDVQPTDDPDVLSSWEKTWELLSPWLQPDEAEILRKDVYRFHSLLAEKWREGRLLIAGDAAHLMTPKLGQGLCTGMRDSANLAWKLSQVLKGASSDTLLDSYEVERKPAARQYVEISAFLANEILVHSHDPGGSSAPEVQQIALERQRLAPESSRSTDDLVGALSAQPTLTDGTPLDDLLGYAFAMLISTDLAANLDDNTERLLSALGAVTVVADDPSVAAYLAECERGALLLRPDRYIAGSATTPDDVRSMLVSAVANYAALVG